MTITANCPTNFQKLYRTRTIQSNLMNTKTTVLMAGSNVALCNSAAPVAFKVEPQQQSSTIG